MNKMLNKEEVAGLLDCESETVEAKAREGKLPAVKFGRSWIFPRDALLQHLNALAIKNTIKPASELHFVSSPKDGRARKVRPDLSQFDPPTKKPD